jgi:hypothetical protein
MHADGRNQHDVDLRMTEDPEEVLPQDRVTARHRIVEVRTDLAVELEQ